MFPIKNQDQQRLEKDENSDRSCDDRVKVTRRESEISESFGDGARMVLDFERCYVEVNLIRSRILDGEFVS